MRFLLAGATALVLSTASLAAPGDLDPAFGNGGKVIVPMGSLPTTGKSVALLGDGKIVIAGATSSSLLLVRLDANGTLDPTFGAGGKVITSDPKPAEVVSQPDGKVIVLSPVNPGVGPNRVMRFNVDGSRDTSFGTSGTVGVFNAARVRVQPDGKIVTAGHVFHGPPDNTFYYVLQRFLSDGTPDSTFGAGGRQEIAIGTSPFSAATALALAPDGKYVVSGYAHTGVDYAIVTVRTLADGTPDASFGTEGQVLADIRMGHDTPSDVVVQPDGGVVVVGDPIGVDWVVIRYLPNGTPDPGFGSNGVVFIEVNGAFMAVALQADGRIVAAGYVDTGGSVIRFVAVRFLANGARDSSFGTLGVRDVAVRTTYDRAEDIVIQPDGKIVLAGTSGNPVTNDARLAAARLDAAGNDDPTFASAGKFAPPLLESPATQLRSVKIRPDGRILAAGGTRYDEFGNSLALVQVNPDGAFDASFGENGKAIFSFSRGDAYSLALQPDGKALVAWTRLSSPSTCAVSRFNMDGTADTSFGTSGMRAFNASTLEEPRAAVVVQPDGKIVLACPGVGPNDSHAQIIRLHPNGATDASFATNGIATVTVGPSFDLINAIAIQPDGRIVVAGKTRSASNVYRMLVMRFEANGSLDPSQVWQFSFTTADAVANSVIVQPDGKIVIAGTADVGRGVPDIGVIRLRADGTLDASFGDSGKVAIAWGGLSTAEEVLNAPDGRLYIAGMAFLGDRNTMGLLRLKVDGSLDASFGDGGHAVVPMDPFMGGWGAALQPDGKPVLVGGPYEGPVYNLHGAAPQGAVIARFLGGAFAVGRYDFNSNARPDVIFRNSSSGDTFVWRMSGHTFESDLFMANVDPSWRMVGHGDFNGDGKNDVVWRNMMSGATYVWYLNDGVLQSDAFLFAIDPVWMIEAVDDFDHDGHPDFLFRHQTSGVGFIWYFNNTTPVRDQFLFSIDNSWIVENTGDFNNDGYPDFFFRNTSSGLGFVWYWDGTALGASNFLFSIDPVWQVVQIVDWNGDGFVDLVFHNASTGVTFVWYTNGTSLQGSDFLFQVDPQWEIVPYR